jgi:tRNA(Ile)-lysidine synthase
MRHSNVETSVRRMRYRALFHACRDHDAKRLLVAHHEDDQYETILARLSSFHNRGLSGIHSLSNIPECSDLYGCESGLLRPNSAPLKDGKFLTGVQGIEEGGVQMGRPLLGFSKDRLIATCEQFEIPWVEDGSNKDKTLTMRNAIRFMLRNHKLPAALGRNSLVQVGRRKDEQNRASWEQAEKLFNESDIQLDIRTGSLTAIVPEPKYLIEHSSKKAYTANGTTIGHAKTVEILLTRRLAGLVAPEPNLELSAFATPENSNNFTAGNVHIIRSSEKGLLKDTKRWTLSRRPLSSRPIPWDPIEGYISEKSSLAIPFPPNTNDEANFRLWDGRYWIHIRNNSPHTLWVRHLTAEQLKSLRDNLRDGQSRLRYSQRFLPKPEMTRRWDYNTMPSPVDFVRLPQRLHKQALDAVLNGLVKGSTKLTLPIIEARDPISEELAVDAGVREWEGSVLAFPTLGLQVVRPNDPFLENVKWEMRFKKIDLGVKKLEDCVVGMKEFRLPNLATDDILQPPT